MEQIINNRWPLLFCEVESLKVKNPDGSPFCWSVNAAVLDNGRVLSVGHLLDPDMPKDQLFRVFDPSQGPSKAVMTKYAETDPRLDLGYIDMKATGRSYKPGSASTGEHCHVTWCRTDKGQIALGYSVARIEGPCSMYTVIDAEGNLQPKMRVTSQPEPTDSPRVMLSLPKPVYSLCGAVVTDLFGGLIGLVNFSLPPRESTQTLMMTSVVEILKRPGAIQ